MLKYIVRKLLLGYKASSEDYINKIKMGGGTVGKNVHRIRHILTC